MQRSDDVVATWGIDPYTVLRARVTRAIASAFGPDYASVDPVIRPSKPEFGDFQANFAMGLARQLGRPARDIASTVVDVLDVEDVCAGVEIAGPGFVNLTLRTDWLDERANEMLGDAMLGVAAAAEPERVVVDYSAPNVAKEMHVGHLRTTIIGDALVRILEFLGHDVVRANHVGDWGTPFGMLIEHFLDIGRTQAANELSVGNLTVFYQQARAKFDGDPDFAERSRRRVVALQEGDQTTLDLWRLLVEQSERYFSTVYDLLGVLLTSEDYAGESTYNDALDDVVKELDQAGLLVDSDGALCVFPPGFTGREGNPLPLIVRKRDGGYGYATTDLAAVRHRTQELGASRLIYVVGAEQRLHLSMVFEAARQAGWLSGERRAQHATIGAVRGADGKRLRTRSGESIKLVELLEEAIARAARGLEVRDDLPADERQTVARQIGIGAIKYADLSVDRERDYLFNWDTMFALEGNTGPYLQYAVARIQSVINRSGETAIDAGKGRIMIGHHTERALVLHALGFGREMHAVSETLQPHRLCGYLFDLATRFTAFYESVPILRADDDLQRSSRLALSVLTARTLSKGLQVLGIEVPRRM